MPKRKGTSNTKSSPVAESYRHPTADALLRPDVGTQAQFKKKKAPRTYCYDSSLSPQLEWDGQNPAREVAEALISRICACGLRIAELAKNEPSTERDQEIDKLRGEIAEGESRLRRISGPFLNWAGKAERLSFDVPTLPLFVHERLSTKAILETLKGHKRDRQMGLFELFGDPQRPVHEQVLQAYEHRNGWVNRMVLGDSLVVMNSLLRYESLGGQVQMIYMDPPYGVKFGSNFQPFIRKRDVTHNDDEDMTREPEMVQAYRDTWELGLHSYLTYLRDRLLLCRDLLHPTGSIFVQISDENLHHVREIMDEVFGEENSCCVIGFAKSSGTTSDLLPAPFDYLLWYARDRNRIKYRQIFMQKQLSGVGGGEYSRVILPDGIRRGLTEDEIVNPSTLPRGAKIYRLDNLISQGFRQFTTVPFEFGEKTYHPGENMNWKTTVDGLRTLASVGRIEARANSLGYVRYFDDFPVVTVNNAWTDTVIAGRPGDKTYVVQTSPKVAERCLLMTTDPGDLVLDPTCGSGTTAYVAEQWGRRWITIDTSRVPLALARQRLLSATYQYYELQDPALGPAGGFVYKRRQNSKGEEVGGIVPHITLKSIANNEPPKQEVLVDRPEEERSITRVSGPFCFEATIPTPIDWEGDGVEDSGTVSAQDYGSFVDRMIEVLRKSPLLRLEGNRSVTLKNVRLPAKTLSLSAEAFVEGQLPGKSMSLDEAVTAAAEASGKVLPLSTKPVALVFGPENGAVSENLVYEAAKEAYAKSYAHLFVFGFAIQPNARKLIEEAEAVMGISASYVQATPDLMMGDLLKNMRSSQIFSVCGSPEVRVKKFDQKPPVKASQAFTPPLSTLSKGGRNLGETRFQVELLGLDVFDPITMDVSHVSGNDVPAWFLDTDYNGLCFHVSQAFFPRTSAWDNLKRALKGEYEDSVWEHLAGSQSAPFEAGEHGQIAVKVIDQRGNELLVVKNLKEAKE